MNPLLSPLVMILLKWTALLALGWVVHGFLRKWHPRARLVLWRSILCFTLLVPVMQFAPISLLRIPVYQAAVPELPGTVPSARGGNTISNNKSAAEAATQPVKASASAPVPARGPVIRRLHPASIGVPWRWLPLIVLGIGSCVTVLRLAHGQFQLNRLRRESRAANATLQEQARTIRAALDIKRRFDVRISDSAVSPFACGLLRPVIILPQTLAQELPPEEVLAVLAHEIAHFRRNDLFWCVGWRWMQALFWFHPLVWKIPAAHHLACEQEADRVASGQLEDRGRYTQLLARLALRILEPPAAETRLALSAAAQVTQRLNHLKRGESGNWNWKYSAGIFALVAMLFLIATGCSTTSDTEMASAPRGVKFREVLVVVQDEDAKPIAGATILPNGFRVNGIHSPDAYGWRKNIFGPPEKAVTDSEGKAYVKYPVEGIPDEKEYTGALIFTVSHPGFAVADVQTYYVDRPETPIQLQRAAQLEVSAYFGVTHQPVANLVPVIEPDRAHTLTNGVLTFDQLSPGGHLIQLMGRLASGEIVYSDATAFTAVAGNPCKLDLEMKPGIRLEGRIDDNVPRPVRNGRVMVDVRAPQYPVNDVVEDFYAPDDKYGGYMARRFWHSYRPINADGTFVFESVPPGEADVVVLGDGFVSKTTGKLYNWVNGVVTTNGPVMGLPQAFPLRAPVTQIEIKTEPTATLEFTAVTKSGKPIEGVWVGMYPGVFRMWGPFAWQKKSSEEPYRQIPHLPDLDFSGKTDGNGRLVLSNLPPEIRGLEIEDPKYQVPVQQPKGWRDRHVRTAFSPGLTNQLHMVMEPKGTDFLGTVR